MLAVAITQISYGYEGMPKQAATIPVPLDVFHVVCWCPWAG